MGRIRWGLIALRHSPKTQKRVKISRRLFGLRVVEAPLLSYFRCVGVGRLAYCGVGSWAGSSFIARRNYGISRKS